MWLLPLRADTYILPTGDPAGLGEPPCGYLLEQGAGGGGRPLFKKTPGGRCARPGITPQRGRRVAPTPREFCEWRIFPAARKVQAGVSGTEEEVLDLAVLHAATVHGHQHTAELREQIRSMLQDEPVAKVGTA